MRTPRRWMALAAAIALLTVALLPANGAAGTRGIKLYNPPSEEYVGDPDIPDFLTFSLGQARFRLIPIQTPAGLVVILKCVSPLGAKSTGSLMTNASRTRIR
jgi:hypothetical protein